MIFSNILLAGHPFGPIGISEHIRCVFRSFRSVGAMPRVLDIYELIQPDADCPSGLQESLTRKFSEINIFHINGDDVEQALTHLSCEQFPDVYTIIYPAWELSGYPKEWAVQLERFHEIWAPSNFIKESLEKSVAVPVIHMPLACEVLLSSFRGRRYFGIPETTYAFLFFFDFRSYISRKNPYAVVECFRELLRQRPYAHLSLVMKLHGVEHAPNEAKHFLESLSDISDRIILLDKIMDDNDIKNLIRCCDCFVSLHRSEGFGRGLSEAMYLGKPVIATAYSGNMDFMTPENSLLVTYQLVNVPNGAYPFGEGQVWAEPDLEDAVNHMLRLIDDPSLGRRMGQRASLNIRRDFGYRKIGLRYLARVQQIEHERWKVKVDGSSKSLA